MDERKDNLDRIPLEEITCFPQWTTFSWENVTDAMRKSIEENTSKPWRKHSKASGTASSESSEAESESKTASPKSAKLSELGETERQLFAESAQFFKEITTPDDHPSQLVDALKVGLADILSGSGSDDNNHNNVSVDDFSKSLDTSFDTEKFKATQTIGTIPNHSCLPSTGSSGSDDDVSDFSTTESRESVGAESCHSMDASTELQQDCNESNLQAHGNVNNITKEERPVTAALDKGTEGEVSSIPDEQPNIESKNKCVENSKDMLDVENEGMQLDYDDEEDSFEEEDNEGDLEMREEEDIWEKGILAEDLMEFKNYSEKDAEKTKRLYSNQPEASGPDSDSEDDRSDFLQSEDDLPPSGKTYADVVKVGLDPDAITYVVKPVSPPLYQKRTPKESKRKSAKKAKREKRLKRSDIGRELEQHRERGAPHGKRGSNIMPRGRVIPQPYAGKGKSPVTKEKTGGRSSASLPGPRMTQETTSHTKKISRNKPDPSRDVKGGEIHLRKKIKEENIAKLLQEAKLTLAKLTTESLGSYEKVTCLKLQQPPIVCHNTFEVLQTQEINKAKHIKELANRFHQLTEMGVGKAEEFTEIKDILSSLHYLQTKDKYFVEPKEKRKKKIAVPLKKAKSDKSIYWFLVIAMVLLILLFIFRRQWMEFTIFSSIFLFCIQQVKKILEFFDGSNDKDDNKDK